MSRWARFLRLFSPAPASGLPQQLEDFARQAPPAPVVPDLAARNDSIINALSGMGSSKDSGQAGRPDTEREPLTFEELTALWTFNGYANHAVRTLPEEATRRAWKVVDSTSSVDIMADEDERLDVVNRFCEAATWGELYGGAILLIVVDEDCPPGVSASQLLLQPLRPENVRRVRALQVFDAQRAKPHGMPDSDPRSPNYQRPLLWSVTPASGGAMLVVHWSRVLYFGGTPVPPSQRATTFYMDHSVLQVGWDPIRDKTSIDQAGAHTAQTLSQDVITVADLKDVTTGPQASALTVRMKLLAIYKSMLNLVVLGEKETYQTTGRPLTGYADLNSNAKESLAAVQGEPLTRLFGEAPGGLNTDGENQRGIWAQRVSGYQNRKFRPLLRRLYRLIFRSSEGPTGGVEPAKWRIEFLPLDELTAQGVANLRKTHAETDAILVQAQILPADHIARSRFSAEGYSDDLLPYDPDAADAALEIAARAQLAATEAGAAPAPGAHGAPAPVVPPDQGQDATELLTDEAVSTLAATMTEHQIPRCEHNAVNRCRICGIERIRGLALDENGLPKRTAEGEPVWSIAWRPITRVGAIAISPAAE